MVRDNMPLAYAHLEANNLVIGNQYLERRMVTQAGEACVTSSFINKETGRDYSRPGSREFSLSLDGRVLTAHDLAFEQVELSDGNPTEAVVRTRLDGRGLTIDVHYQVYADHPVIRKWIVLTNHGGETITLADLDWEDVNLLVETSASAEVWADYLTRREKSVLVTMDECVLLINDALHHEGFVVATEAPGPLKRLEVYAQPSRVAVGYNRDDETVFEQILAPGEQFQTPASFILTFANPIPQDVIDDEYARFVAERLTVCDVARVPTITINTWVPHTTNIGRDSLLEQIQIAAEIGVDAYQVDDGWYDRMGDWNDDRTKFPNGLEEIAENVRARGMRFGLWIAAASAHEESRVAQEHPDWVARDRHGEPNRHPSPGVLTMCLDSGYYDYILQTIDSVVSRCQVELLKLDLSSVRNLYAPGMYPGCFATDHGHRSPRASHVRILARLFDLVRTLKRRHPDCLVDVSYELYGVMDGTDLGLTQVADQNWFSNITSPNEVSLRREIYQRARVTRPWTLNCGGAILEDTGAPSYGLFSALTAHGVFWGNLAFLDDKTREYYRRWFAWAKEQRGYSDFYRYYRVSNVFPVPDGISGRDYRHAVPTERYGVAPLGIHPPAFDPTSEHPGGVWDGVARLDARGEGPLFLFRPASTWAAYFQLRIPWVEGDSRYRLTDVIAERDLGVIAGRDLIQPGIEIEIPETLGAKVIVLRRID
jgi:alpha-galactosidase